MPYIHPAAREHELRRWMRPDAHRFISPTWRRVVQPGSEAAAIFGLYEAKYRPDQPRVPKGVREGGQWTDDGGGLGGGAAASGGTIEISAASRKGGGHHLVPRAVVKEHELSDEAKRVFDERTTGPLRDSATNLYDDAHRKYNVAVDEALTRYLNENKIDPTRMTAVQANEFVDSVLRSSDPRIRWFNMRIYMREIMLMMRRPRAGE